MKYLNLIFLLGSLSLTAQLQPSWSKVFGGLGTFSSPHVADLNGDGVKDIVIGCGREEFEKTDTAVIAIDGKTSDILWVVGARDQMFGSVTFFDVNRDGGLDVLIPGRSAELKAIDGKTGKVIWEFTKEPFPPRLRQLGFYNFYNPQIIEDQNGDGIEDILVANGGDVTKKADEHDRPPGQLFILDSQDGSIISRALMPDGKEIYCSAVVTKMNKKDKDYTVIFGTGGETISGSLYRVSLSEVKSNDIGNAIPIATSEVKGFIAPPTLIDINDDGTLDIVTNAVEGRMIAIDGETNETLWETNTPNSEAYSAVAPGQFFEKGKFDFFTVYAQGIWPNLTESAQRLVDGETGEFIFIDSLGTIQTSTPIIADITQDGFDDALYSINVFDESFPLKEYFNVLVLYNFKEGSLHQFTRAKLGVNLSITPWAGDLDDDGRLDIIYCYHTESRDIFKMTGLTVNLIKTKIKITSTVKWGAYMGSDYTGVYK